MNLRCMTVFVSIYICAATACGDSEHNRWKVRLGSHVAVLSEAEVVQAYLDGRIDRTTPIAVAKSGRFVELWAWKPLLEKCVAAEKAAAPVAVAQTPPNAFRVSPSEISTAILRRGMTEQEVYSVLNATYGVVEQTVEIQRRSETNDFTAETRIVYRLRGGRSLSCTFAGSRLAYF